MSDKLPADGWAFGSRVDRGRERRSRTRTMLLAFALVATVLGTVLPALGQEEPVEQGEVAEVVEESVVEEAAEPSSPGSSSSGAESPAEGSSGEAEQAPAPAAPKNNPWIKSDKEDYVPGELVTLTGGDWLPGENVNIFVDDDGIREQKWSRTVDVTADSDGQIEDSFSLPDWFVADYLVVATADSGTARTTFTDGNLRFKVNHSQASFDADWSRHNGTNCSNGQRFDQGTTTIGHTNSTLVLAAEATQSVKVTALATVGTRTFSGWTGPGGWSSSSLTICLPGFAGSGIQDYMANYVTTAAPTTTSVGSITASASVFGGTTNLSATVSPANSPGSVSFFVNGSSTPAAGTVSYAQSTGIATLSGLNHGLNASSTAYSVRAVFTSSNTGTHTSSEGTNASALTVSKANQTLSFTAGTVPASALFGGTFTPGATATSGLSPAISVSGGCSILSGVVTMTSGTTACLVKASQAGDTNYNPAPEISQSVTAGKAAATIHLSGLSKTYTGSPQAATATTTPAGLSGVSITYDGSPSTPTNAGSYLVSASLNHDDYAATPATGTLVIAPKSVTVTPDSDQSKVFGTALDPVLTFTLSEAVATTGALARAEGENVGTYAINLGSLASSSTNHTLALSATTVSFSITPKPVTITPSSGQGKVYGSPDPVLTFSNSEGLGDVFSGALSRAAGDDVGDYAIGLGSLSAGSNYSLSLAEGSYSFSITPKTVTVLPTANQSKVYGQADPAAFAYTLSESVPVNGALDRVPGEDVGTYAINLGSLVTTSGNHTLALSATVVSFSITPKPVTVTPDPGQSKIFGASDPALTYALSEALAVTGSLGRAPGETVGSYAFDLGTLATSSTNHVLVLAHPAGSFTITGWLIAAAPFKQPVDNVPTWNVVKAGSAVPVKFSLGGDKGTNIFSAGFPKPESIACDSAAQLDGIETTVAATANSLTYDSVSDTYTYVWKTDKAFATGTGCRQLVMRFLDGTIRRANFKFTK
ncbi:MAG TPA: PxKF domain-containing protein [Actinomycetota bacterium]|nr:PxKF domain-containing protein [Actinomycetota bacterium]